MELPANSASKVTAMQLEEILDIIDRPAAWRWIVRRYFPDGVKCPNCGSPITGEKALAAFSCQERTYCRNCDKSFRPRALTPLAGTEWEPEEFVKLMALSVSGRRTVEIAETLGKSAGCVKGMIERVELVEMSRTMGGVMRGHDHLSSPTD